MTEMLRDRETDCREEDNLLKRGCSRCRAFDLDTGTYPKRIKVTDEETASLESAVETARKHSN
jgi:hypothetical protein